MVAEHQPSTARKIEDESRFNTKTENPIPEDKMQVTLPARTEEEQKSVASPEGGIRREQTTGTLRVVRLKKPAEEKKEVAPAGDSLLVQPLKVNDVELESILTWYKTQCSAPILKSFCELAKLLEKADSGYEPSWVCFVDSSYPKEGAKALLSAGKLEGIRGLAVFHLDPASQTRKRVFILHASTCTEAAEPTTLRTCVAKLVDYIWANVNCEEIRVGLTHLLQEDGKRAPYELLKSAFLALNFRWKTLINDQPDNRILVLGATRPLTTLFANPR